MQNDKDEKGVTKSEPKKKGGRLPTTIFSKREIKSMVKGFMLALLRGHIKINFKTAKEIITEAKVDGKKISFEDASKREIAHKAVFLQLNQVCDGTISANNEEVEKAMYDLFDYILSLRIGQRIEGRFYGTEIEERLDRLEEGLDKTNRVVEEFVMWLKQGRMEK